MPCKLPKPINSNKQPHIHRSTAASQLSSSASIQWLQQHHMPSPSRGRRQHTKTTAWMSLKQPCINSQHDSEVGRITSYGATRDPGTKLQWGQRVETSKSFSMLCWAAMLMPAHVPNTVLKRPQKPSLLHWVGMFCLHHSLQDNHPYATTSMQSISTMHSKGSRAVLAKQSLKRSICRCAAVVSSCHRQGGLALHRPIRF